ncbi:hypothetical protein Hanom_Chr15g01382761 [Helianthus anomalus]
MFVTKSNITNDVSSLKNNLEQVSDDIAITKKHLTQKVENLDRKLDKQVEISKSIQSKYLCNKFEGNVISGNTQVQFKLAGKSVGGSLSSGGMIALEGVNEIPDILDSGDVNWYLNLPLNLSLQLYSDYLKP